MGDSMKHTAMHAPDNLILKYDDMMTDRMVALVIGIPRGLCFKKAIFFPFFQRNITLTPHASQGAQARSTADPLNLRSIGFQTRLSCISSWNRVGNFLLFTTVAFPCLGRYGVFEFV